MPDTNTDRYISFSGLDCDGKAQKLAQYIERYAQNSSQLSEYFRTKLENRISLGQDELFFTCSQINTVRDLFEENEDTEALNLLGQIEEDCC